MRYLILNLRSFSYWVCTVPASAWDWEKTMAIISWSKWQRYKLSTSWIWCSSHPFNCTDQ